MALLIAAPWPGNVRQLLNLLEQAVALATTSLIPESLVQGSLREDASALVPFEEARKTFERDYLVASEDHERKRDAGGASRQAQPHRVLQAAAASPARAGDVQGRQGFLSAAVA
jgi:DNA-binding NtrC family response regulator